MDYSTEAFGRYSASGFTGHPIGAPRSLEVGHHLERVHGGGHAAPGGLNAVADLGMSAARSPDLALVAAARLAGVVFFFIRGYSPAGSMRRTGLIVLGLVSMARRYRLKSLEAGTNKTRHAPFGLAPRSDIGTKKARH